MPNDNNVALAAGQVWTPTKPPKPHKLTAGRVVVGVDASGEIAFRHVGKRIVYWAWPSEWRRWAEWAVPTMSEGDDG